MADFTAKIDKQIKDVEGRFEQLETQRGQLAKQRADLDRQLNQIVGEQMRLQGEARGLESLKNEKPEPELKIPKEKK